MQAHVWLLIRKTTGIVYAVYSDRLNSQHDFFFFIFQALNGERIPKNQKDKAHFISKYEGRKNGGIPCFAEERSVERAAKVFLLAI